MCVNNNNTFLIPRKKINKHKYLKNKIGKKIEISYLPGTLLNVQNGKEIFIKYKFQWCNLICFSDPELVQTQGGFEEIIFSPPATPTTNPMEVENSAENIVQ